MKRNYKIKYIFLVNSNLLQNFFEYNTYSMNKIFEF